MVFQPMRTLEFPIHLPFFSPIISIAEATIKLKANLY
jgi:hypothetical protein